ncbi:hypothetical protein [Streptomyces acidiscabies]|uniref:hypothetical protein n=1 Tax=Streptomyces acidiscabies TaxID=42234 RepID=UPI000951A6C6|nr:hypothetical protein [Streptomyces acidiscabies]
MLQFLGALDLPEALVYLDDIDDRLGYVLPKNVILRRDPGGRAVFKFIKYRSARPLPGGGVGAGLVFMDVELALTPEQDQSVRTRFAQHVTARRGPGAPPVEPDQVTLSKPAVTKAEVAVSVLSDSGALVQKVRHAGVPSMYGNNVVAISAELSQFGVPVFEAAMSGQGAGGVWVQYHLHFAGRVPPVTVTGTWTAQKFYSFMQDLNIDDSFCGDDEVTEKIEELFVNSESRRVFSDPGTLETSDPEVAKMLSTLEASVTQQLDDMIQRNILEAIPPESRDISKWRDEDYEKIHREVTTNKIADVRIEVTRNQVFGIDVNPQNNIQSLPSQGYNWPDYMQLVDTDDPFFRQLNLNILVNADFAQLPIFSVEVKIDYPPHTSQHGIQTFTFRGPEDLGKFTAFMDGATGEFRYQYVVNYVGESRTFTSPWVTDTTTDLVINIDELGLWLVDIELGDMNFEQVKRAVLTLEHPAVNGGAPLVQRFQIDERTTRLSVKEVLLQPVQPYGGSVKYFMQDGREFVRNLSGLTGQRFYVDDPFSANRTVQVRTRGDFERSVDTIFLDLSYEDEVNGYRQTDSVALSKDKRFLDWRFPVIDERAGKVTWRTVTTFRDGSDKDSGEQTLTGSLLLVGPASDTLTVTVVPDLVNWSVIKLAKVTLHYTDPANQIEDTETLVFRKGDSEKTYERVVLDRTMKRYEWQVDLFAVDGGAAVHAQGAGTDEVLIIEIPT